MNDQLLIENDWNYVLNMHSLSLIKVKHQKTTITRLYQLIQRLRDISQEQNRII